jgi:DNA-binding NarL/FixJ family response regulator
MSDGTTNRPSHLRLLPESGEGTQQSLIVVDRGTGFRDPGEDSSDLIRVLVAEGQPLVRAGYRALLERDKQIRVVAEAGSGPDTVPLAAETDPDVVLLDLGLPGLDPLETVAAIVSRAVDVAVLVLASGDDEERVFSALSAGAVGVLHKGQSAELVRAVQVLARGHGLLPEGVMHSLLEERPRQQPLERPTPRQLQELTEREREVVALVAMGLSNGQIAEQLVISPRTAKTHVSRAMVKLGARHRAQLVVLAYEAGLVSPSRDGQAPGDRPDAPEAAHGA